MPQRTTGHIVLCSVRIFVNASFIRAQQSGISIMNNPYFLSFGSACRTEEQGTIDNVFTIRSGKDYLAAFCSVRARACWYTTMVL